MSQTPHNLRLSIRCFTVGKYPIYKLQLTQFCKIVNIYAMSFAKLFSSITESSLWSEPKEARLLFVSMLARADATGFVEAAVPGLQRLANLTEPEVGLALEILTNPDPHSKNPDNEGRRVIKVPGGWMILNFEEYRNRRGDEERREYMRDYMKKYREGSVNSRKLSVNSRKPPLNAVKRGKPPLAQAEAEAEAEVQGSDKASKRLMPGEGGKLAASAVEAVQLAESVLNGEWVNDAGKWVGRAKVDAGKVFRVMADVRSAVVEGRVKTSPARMAEHNWKVFQ